MDIRKENPLTLIFTFIAFVMYWVVGPVVGFLMGPEYVFTPVWWVIAQVIFLPLTLMWVINGIRKIAEPGEVRWFRNPELLEIPPKAEKP
jgi:fatty acid desaturase